MAAGPFGGGQIRARVSSRTIAPSAEHTSNVVGLTVFYVVEPPDARVLHLLTTTAPKFREAAQALIRVTKERGRQVLERVRKVVTHRGLTGLKGVFLDSVSRKVALRTPARCWPGGGRVARGETDGLA